MAVKLQQQYHQGQACNLLLSIGSLDDETETYEVNRYQLKHLEKAASCWLDEVGRGRKVESVTVQDDGGIHIKRR